MASLKALQDEIRQAYDEAHSLEKQHKGLEGKAIGIYEKALEMSMRRGDKSSETENVRALGGTIGVSVERCNYISESLTIISRRRRQVSFTDIHGSMNSGCRNDYDPNIEVEVFSYGEQVLRVTCHDAVSPANHQWYNVRCMEEGPWEKYLEELHKSVGKGKIPATDVEKK